MAEVRKELPNGWSEARIEEICLLNPKHHRDLPDQLEITFVPMSAVDDESGEITMPERRTLTEVRKGYTHFREADVIWAKITPCMENGKAALARGLINGMACGSTEFYVLRSQGATLPEFLYHYVRQESFRRRAKSKMTSAAGHARVPKDFLLQEELPIPPLNEQERIVAKIKQIQAHSRRTREALKTIPNLLEQLRQSILAAAFRGDLTRKWREDHPDVEPASQLLKRIRAERRNRWEESELEKLKRKNLTGEALDSEFAKRRKQYPQPESIDPGDLPPLPHNWCYASLSELSSAVKSIRYGVLQPGDETGTGVRLVRVCDLHDENVSTDGLRTVSPSVDGQYRETRLKGGELLVSVVGTIGRLALVPAELVGANIARAVARVIPSADLPSSWLTTMLSSPFLQDWLNRGAREVARKTLNIGVLEKAPIPLAPSSEMKEILIQIERQRRYTHMIRELIPGIESQVLELDHVVLSKAFRGELVPQDPNDEPASVLLERIRREKERLATEEKPSSKRRGRTMQ